MDTATPLLVVEPGLDVPASLALAFSDHCRLSAIPDVLGLVGSGRDRPGILEGGAGTGRSEAPRDVFLWTLPADEFGDFVGVALEKDVEDGSFATLTLDRVISGDGGNLVLAIGTEPGVMAGFMVRDRTLRVDRDGTIRYGFECDRAYLLPEARGQGLSKTMVAISKVVFRHEMETLAEGLSRRAGRTVLTPVLTGYADSDGGARMLNLMRGEMGDAYAVSARGPGEVEIGALIDGIDSYEPEALPTP